MDIRWQKVDPGTIVTVECIGTTAVHRSEVQLHTVVPVKKEKGTSIKAPHLVYTVSNIGKDQWTLHGPDDLIVRFPTRRHCRAMAENHLRLLIGPSDGT